jgi:cytochrome c oxidase subunit 2
MRSVLVLIVVICILSCTSNRNNNLVSAEKAESSAAVEADLQHGKVIFNTCIPCHGDKAQGILAQHAPAIVNQESWYLETQLLHFQQGIRGGEDDTLGASMAAIARSLAGRKDISNVIAYIKTLPSAGVEKTISGNIKEGQDKYNMICGACHGPGASGNLDLHAPKLTGVNDWYLVRQLQNYRKGIRGSHPQDTLGAQMQSMANTLADEQSVKDIAAYIQSLQVNP